MSDEENMKCQTTAHPGSSLTSKTTQIINQALPWVVILAVIAATAFGMAVSNQNRIADINETVADLRTNYATRFEQQKEDFTWKIEELRKAADKSETETRLLQYYVIQTDSKLVTRGALSRSETWSAKQERENAR